MLITVHSDARAPVTQMTALKRMCSAYFHLHSKMSLTMSAQETMTSLASSGVQLKLMKRASMLLGAKKNIGDIAVKVSSHKMHEYGCKELHLLNALFYIAFKGFLCILIKF
jgi:hypothetical protein